MDTRQTHPKNMATLDHVYSQLLARLYRDAGHAFGARAHVVLACRRCNAKRSFVDKQYRKGCVPAECFPDYLRSTHPEFLRLWLGRPTVELKFTKAPPFATFEMEQTV